MTRRTRIRAAYSAGVLLLAAAALWRAARPGREARPVLHFAGRAMGTTYSILVVVPGSASALGDWEAGLGGALRRTMDRVVQSMSGYLPESEISRFNRAGAGEPFPVSGDLEEVARFALHLAEVSGGVYDPTLGPLLRLWGFGPGAMAGGREPSAEDRAGAAERVGHRNLRLQDGRLVKLRDGVELDLNSVAKGYGVDAVARTIREWGAADYMVEIGGEVAVSGANALGAPWRIGVDRPDPGARPGARLARVLHLAGGGLATSGDYRNYREGPGGRVESHLFDPLAGRPVPRTGSSVTVLAPGAMMADGLATALHVMGPEAGLPWLARHFPCCDALFLELLPDGAVAERASPGFEDRVRPPGSGP